MKRNFMVAMLCCAVFIVGCSGCGDGRQDENYLEANVGFATDIESDVGEIATEENVNLSATVAHVKIVLEQKGDTEAADSGEPKTVDELQEQFDDFNDTIEELREDFPDPDDDSQGAENIPGQRFSVKIIVDSGDARVGAYQFALMFDADVVSVNTAIGYDGVEIGKNGFLAAVNPNIPGELILNGFNPFGSTPGEEVELVIVHLIDRQEDGNQVCSTLSLEVEVLTDEMGVPIETPENEDMAVSINCQK